MSKSRTFEFEEIDLPALELPIRHQTFLSAVAPRPIAFAGTVDVQGNANLSPFSFFNAFGSNPAYIGISPAFGGKDGAPKHTYLNALATREFTVSIVNYDMVEQASLASCNYAQGVDEFVKAGFTKHPSKKIKAPGVAEAPCILECRLFENINLGGKNASGNLLIGEVVYMHLKRGMRNEQGVIDPYKMDQVSRLGYEWYGRAREGLFEVFKPRWNGIGFDALPKSVLESELLTGNELARLAGVKELPDFAVMVAGSGLSAEETALLAKGDRAAIEKKIQAALAQADTDRAWRWVGVLERLVSGR